MGGHGGEDNGSDVAGGAEGRRRGNQQALGAAPQPPGEGGYILGPFRASSALYLICILSFIPLVSVIGWFGASLTFPIEKE